MSTRLEELRSRRREILSIAARHKVVALAVFGSVARGEDNEESDIDFLVDFAPGASLIDEFHLQEELQELLHMPVDVVSRGGLKPRDTHIRQEALALLVDPTINEQPTSLMPQINYQKLQHEGTNSLLPTH